MNKFTTYTGSTVPLNIKDVDTDMLIPAQYLTSTSKDGYGENLFQRLRDHDPDFPLNKPEYQDSDILVADDNFGCGSSREHAVWALQGWGFKVVIAKSFADIFFANSAKNGLLLISLPTNVVNSLLAQASVKMTVNLEEQLVSFDETEVRFEYDPFRKFCLINGLNDIDYILDKKSDIDSFREAQEKTRFYKINA